MKDNARIKIAKNGVFYVTAIQAKKIAAPIHFYAIGDRLDGSKVVEIHFRNCDGKKLSEQFNMSTLNPRNLSIIADGLANKGYLWPVLGPSPIEILRAVIAEIPSRRFILVGAPGWYDSAIVTPLRQYGGTKRISIDTATGAHLASYTQGPGSLEGWQNTVGRCARNSTRLRLSISAAFAAPLLRPLGMDSFALNLFGPTSIGKTSLLCGAASVPGLNSNTGLPRWADSDVGIEQLAIGHRDGLLPLDETGDQGGNIPVHEKARRLAFLFSRNRAKTLDKAYEKKINLTVRDFRVIVLSTSESALNEIAKSAGRCRIGGEEVRFIDVPATDTGTLGVFDSIDVPHAQDAGEFGRKLADQLRHDAETHQGFAIDAFLENFTRNPERALAKVKRRMDSFLSRSALAGIPGPRHRIRANFALIYAAASLEIDYKIVPWGKKATQAAIMKCMVSALENVVEASPSRTQTGLLSLAAESLEKRLTETSLIRIEKGMVCSEEESRRRESAGGFRIGSEIYVKSNEWNKFSAAEGRELVAHKILRIEKRADRVLTVSRKIAGIEKKLRYYIIDTVALDRVLHSVSSNLTHVTADRHAEAQR